MTAKQVPYSHSFPSDWIIRFSIIATSFSSCVASTPHSLNRRMKVKFPACRSGVVVYWDKLEPLLDIPYHCEWTASVAATTGLSYGHDGTTTSHGCCDRRRIRIMVIDFMRFERPMNVEINIVVCVFLIYRSRTRRSSHRLGIDPHSGESRERDKCVP